MNLVLRAALWYGENHSKASKKKYNYLSILTSELVN